MNPRSVRVRSDQCYPFLDQFDICGIVDKHSEKEQLVLIHKPTKDFTSIACFHTVVGSINTENDKWTYHSTENIPSVNLSFESKEIAVKGIAQYFSENGLEAFSTQHGIEDLTQITPWSQQLLPFIAKHDPAALNLHFDRTVKVCQWDNPDTQRTEPHLPCLIANLAPFVDQLLSYDPDLAIQMYHQIDPKMTRLNLRFRKLTQLPSSIALLSNLKTLDMTGNNLSVLPPSFASLKLSYLSIAKNEAISQIPVAETSDLRQLDISNTSIKALPPVLCERFRQGKLTVASNYPLDTVYTDVDYLCDGPLHDIVWYEYEKSAKSKKKN